MKVVLRREVEAKIVTDARLAEVQNIQDKVQTNRDAISDFAATYK